MKITDLRSLVAEFADVSLKPSDLQGEYPKQLSSNVSKMWWPHWENDADALEENEELEEAIYDINKEISSLRVRIEYATNEHVINALDNAVDSMQESIRELRKQQALLGRWYPDGLKDWTLELIRY